MKHSATISAAILVAFLFPATAAAQSDIRPEIGPTEELSKQPVILPAHTLTFAQKDGQDLKLDIYLPAISGTPKAASSQDAAADAGIQAPAKPAILFIFGGGFFSGDRVSGVTPWAKMMTEEGFPVISIDYRLGLKGVNNAGVNLNFIKALRKAVDMAVEDLFSAVNFLLTEGSKYGIDANNLVICGSSAGAVTALQAEYEICNGTALTSVLPEGYNFAGLMPFSGAIFDTKHSHLRFNGPLCPMALFHGTADKLVTYKKIAIPGMCFAGTHEIAKRLAKADRTFQVYRYEGQGHEVSCYMEHCFEREIEFLTNEVMLGRGRSIDALINDPTAPSPEWGKADFKKTYAE